MGLNKVYLAASVYAEEHNILHSPHLVSQGERSGPNLATGLAVLTYTHAKDTVRSKIQGVQDTFFLRTCSW